jgi:hypothetical protein
MKVLVATKQTQGFRSNDFCFAGEGDLLRFGVVCRKDADNPDGPCGCGRALSSMANRKGTTTMLVVDQPFDKEQFTQKYVGSLVAAKFYASDSIEARAEVADEIDALLAVADSYPVGTVLEWRYREFAARTEKSHPLAK